MNCSPFSSDKSVVLRVLGKKLGRKAWPGYTCSYWLPLNENSSKRSETLISGLSDHRRTPSSSSSSSFFNHITYWERTKPPGGMIWFYQQFRRVISILLYVGFSFSLPLTGPNSRRDQLLSPWRRQELWRSGRFPMQHWVPERDSDMLGKINLENTVSFLVFFSPDESSGHRGNENWILR